MKLTKLVVASHNDGKVAEIKALLAPLHIEVQSARELRLGDVEETGKTFEENAKNQSQRAEFDVRPALPGRRFRPLHRRA